MSQQDDESSRFPEHTSTIADVGQEEEDRARTNSLVTALMNVTMVDSQEELHDAAAEALYDDGGDDDLSEEEEAEVREDRAQQQATKHEYNDVAPSRQPAGAEPHGTEVESSMIAFASSHASTRFPIHSIRDNYNSDDDDDGEGEEDHSSSFVGGNDDVIPVRGFSIAESVTSVQSGRLVRNASEQSVFDDELFNSEETDGRRRLRRTSSTDTAGSGSENTEQSGRIVNMEDYSMRKRRLRRASSVDTAESAVTTNTEQSGNIVIADESSSSESYYDDIAEQDEHKRQLFQGTPSVSSDNVAVDSAIEYSEREVGKLHDFANNRPNANSSTTQNVDYDKTSGHDENYHDSIYSGTGDSTKYHDSIYSEIVHPQEYKNKSAKKNNKDNEESIYSQIVYPTGRKPFDDSSSQSPSSISNQQQPPPTNQNPLHHSSKTSITSKKSRTSRSGQKNTRENRSKSNPPNIVEDVSDGEEIEGPVPLKDDPRYETYYQMKKMGMPKGAIAKAMVKDGVDAYYVDKENGVMKHLFEFNPYLPLQDQIAPKQQQQQQLDILKQPTWTSEDEDEDEDEDEPIHRFSKSDSLIPRFNDDNDDNDGDDDDGDGESDLMGEKGHLSFSFVDLRAGNASSKKPSPPGWNSIRGPNSIRNKKNSPVYSPSAIKALSSDGEEDQDLAPTTDSEDEQSFQRKRSEYIDDDDDEDEGRSIDEEDEEKRKAGIFSKGLLVLAFCLILLLIIILLSVLLTRNNSDDNEEPLNVQVIVNYEDDEVETITLQDGCTSDDRDGKMKMQLDGFERDLNETEVEFLQDLFVDTYNNKVFAGGCNGTHYREISNAVLSARSFSNSAADTIGRHLRRNLRSHNQRIIIQQQEQQQNWHQKRRRDNEMTNPLLTEWSLSVQCGFVNQEPTCLNSEPLFTENGGDNFLAFTDFVNIFADELKSASDLGVFIQHGYTGSVIAETITDGSHPGLYREKIVADANTNNNIFNNSSSSSSTTTTTTTSNNNRENPTGNSSIPSAAGGLSRRPAPQRNTTTGPDTNSPTFVSPPVSIANNSSVFVSTPVSLPNNTATIPGNNANASPPVVPTDTPTTTPTEVLVTSRTAVPTSPNPTRSPTDSLVTSSPNPSSAPTVGPSSAPSAPPSTVPTFVPSSRPSAAPTTAPSAAPAVFRSTIGMKSWAGVLIDYCGSGDDCDPRSSLTQMWKYLVMRDNSVVKYFLKASYEQFDLDLDVFGWIDADVPLQEGDINAACFPLEEDRFKYLVGFNPSVVLDDYDGFLFLIRRPKHISCPAGIAIAHETQETVTHTNQGTITTRIVMAGATIEPENFSKIASYTIARDMLHTYGQESSDAIHCYNNQIISSDGGGCRNQVNGDYFGIMGNPIYASHPGPVVLDNLGWINAESDMQIVSKSGSYTIHPLEQADSPVKALRIDIVDPIPLFGSDTNSLPLQMDRVYVHYRTFTGFDDRIIDIPLDGGGSWSPPEVNGALIHAADCTQSEPSCHAILLDMNPAPNLLGQSFEPTDTPNRVGDAMLYLGETRDLIKLSIETIDIVPGESISVFIYLGEVPSQILIRSVPPSGPYQSISWHASIHLKDRLTELETDVYVYSETNVHFTLQSTTAIADTDCPQTIQLEAYESSGGKGDLSDWTSCIDGVLSFVTLTQDEGVFSCNYEAPQVEVRLYNSSTLTCEDMNMVQSLISLREATKQETLQGKTNPASLPQVQIVQPSIPQAQQSTPHLSLSYDVAMSTQKWAAVLINYCSAGDDCDPQSTVEEMTDYLVTRHNSVLNFFAKASYDQFDIGMDVFGWIDATLPLEDAVGYDSCFPLVEEGFQFLVDFNPSVVLRNYDGFLFLVRRPKGISCSTGIADGNAAQELNTFTDQETITTRVVMAGASIEPDNFSRITSTAIAQNMLRTYGQEHSNAIECDSNEIMTLDGTGCRNRECGDLFGIMGNPTYSTHPTPVLLDNLGWIKARTDMHIITKSGSYTLNPLEKADSRVKALRIDIEDPIPLFESDTNYPVPLQMDRIYIHYRTFTGFDDRNIDIPLVGGDSWSPPKGRGALIHAADCSLSAPICRSILLDMNPEANLLGQASEPSNDANRVADAMLYLGQRRNLAGLAVETTSVELGVSLTVRVFLGEVPSMIVVRPVPSEETASFELGAWDAEVHFRDRTFQFNTNLYSYSKEKLQYKLESTSHITASDCPRSIELEQYRSYGFEGDLSSFHVCYNGHLSFVEFSMEEETYVCRYESSRFEILLYKGTSSIGCENVSL